MKLNSGMVASGNIYGAESGFFEKQVSISGISVGDFLRPPNVIGGIVTEKTSDHVIIEDKDQYVGLDTSVFNTDLIAYLPSLSTTLFGRTYIIKNEALGGKKKVIITPSGSDTIDGSSKLKLGKKKSSTLLATSGIWREIGKT